MQKSQILTTPDSKNAAHGPQQVNVGNGTPSPSRAENPATEQSKLLGADHERLDTGTAIPAGASDPALATVDEQYGTSHRGG